MTGEVDMVMAWNGRVSALTKEGAKVAFTYNQGILQSTSLCILGDAPNLATAVRFLNEAVDPVHQANLPLHIDYGPGQPEGLRYRRHQAGARRATAERARERRQAGADVLRLVVVAGGRGGGKALGRLHAEIALAATRRGVHRAFRAIAGSQ